MSGTSRTLDRTSMVLGRGNACDWILPDADRILSNQHCRIVWLDGQYILTDTSSNGVFHNHAPSAIGRGASVVLSDGDTLTLGDYDITVAIGRPPDPAADSLWGYGDFEEPFAGLGESSRDRSDGHRGTGNRAGFDPSPPASDSDHVPVDREFFEPPFAREAPPTDMVRGAESAPSAFDTLPDDWFLQFDPSALQPAPPPPPPHPRRHDPETVPAMPTGDDGLAMLRIFLESAGLASAEPAAEPAAVMRRAGAIYRAAIDGLCAVLAMRASFKTELRIDRTVLAAQENNPLKFPGDTALTALQLLQPPRAGFLSGEVAVEQGVRDIQNHELAVGIGMQSALTALLKRFDPQALKDRLDRQSFLASFVPATRRARYWELYEALYREIATEAEDDFHALFGRAFAEAYQRQLDALTAPSPLSSAAQATPQGESC